MNAVLKFATLGLAPDKRTHRVMRRIALDVVKACTRGRSASLNVDDGSALGQTLSWLDTPKGGDYGQVLALHVADLVHEHKAGYAALQRSMRKYADYAQTKDVMAIPDALIRSLPTDVAQKLLHGEGIEESWGKLSDDDAATVALSAPVVVANPDRAIATVIAALQKAANAYSDVNASPKHKALIALLTVPTVEAIAGVRDEIRNEVQRSVASDPSSDDLAVLADAIATVASMQTPSAQTEINAVVRRYLNQLAGSQATTAVATFLGEVRKSYTVDDVKKAFLVRAADDVRVLNKDSVVSVLSKHNIGALVSQIVVSHDLDTAWQTMNILGYFEMLRWPEFQAYASCMPGGSGNRLAKILVKAVVRMNERMLKEVIVDGSIGHDLILHLLEEPTGSEYRMADIHTSNATAKDLTYRLITCANLARGNDRFVDSMLVEYKNLLAAAQVTNEQMASLRKICDACYPKDKCLEFIRCKSC